MAPSIPARADWTLDAEPVFLIGSSRSGTTWLQALLAAHPEVYTGPETHFFRTFEPVRSEFDRTRDRPLGPAEYWTREQFRDTIEALFWSLVSQLPAPETSPRIFLEKTPRHVRHVPFILDVFPQARCLHLIRDGREVTASYLRISQSWGTWAPTTAAGGAFQWSESVAFGLRAPDEIARRGGDPGQQYREVRYEDVKADPEGEASALFAWLGLDPDAARMQDGFNSIPTVGRNTNVQDADPYPQGFVGKGARSDGERKGLTGGQRRMVEVVAGPMLRRLGYPTGGGASMLPASGPVRRVALGVLRRLDRRIRRRHDRQR